MLPGTQRDLASLLAIGWAVVVAVGGAAHAGDLKPAPAPAPAPLPPLNASVVAFARSHVGEPVGDGICITLAVEALQAAGARRFPLNDPAGEYVWGEPVPDLKDVLPGDILQFRDAVFSGSRSARDNRRETWRDTYPHHTAIVGRSAQKGRLITIYHQNVGVRGEDPGQAGKVREAILRMNSLQKGGQIRAYRPVAAIPAPDPPAVPSLPDCDGP